MGKVTRLAMKTRPLTLGKATDAFLDHADLARTSTRVYRASLRALNNGLDSATPLAELDPAALVGWFVARYGHSAPATWNRELAILRSAAHWWCARGWLEADPTARLERRRDPPDRTRALTRAQVEGLWRRGDVALREKALWRLLYETAARANEILALDLGDLDLPNKRARIRSKGGAIDWVFWQTGAAQLLPRLLDRRADGPVFLADRQPTRAVPTLDLDPETGRSRLSYRRAAHLFQAHTGWTLHQLRHSAPGFPRKRGGVRLVG